MGTDIYQPPPRWWVGLLPRRDVLRLDGIVHCFAYCTVDTGLDEIVRAAVSGDRMSDGIAWVGEHSATGRSAVVPGMLGGISLTCARGVDADAPHRAGCRPRQARRPYPLQGPRRAGEATRRPVASRESRDVRKERRLLHDLGEAGRPHIEGPGGETQLTEALARTAQRACESGSAAALRAGMRSCASHSTARATRWRGPSAQRLYHAGHFRIIP